MIGKVIKDDFSMNYCKFGDGARTFVIIPGISTGSMMPLADAIAASFADFTDDYTVYLFDRKDEIDCEYSIMDMASDTAVAMKTLGVDNADIFGASQGGQIAMSLALQNPELVHALYLGSTAAWTNDVSLAALGKWRKLASGGDAFALNHALNTMIYSEEFYADNQEAFEASEDVPVDMTRFYYLATATLEYDVRDRLEEISCPVFVVGSHKDTVLSAEASVELADALSCDLFMYDGYSHAVFDEAPDYRPRILAKLREAWEE